MPDLESLAADIAHHADQCVKCGLCLPHCPNYTLLRNENDSPRGRISLIQGMLSDELPISPALVSHLDRCLGCRACEKACPSTVPYGRLLDDTRYWIRQTALSASQQDDGRSSATETLIDRFTSSPHKTSRLFALLRLYQRSGLQWLLRKTLWRHQRGLGRLDGLLPKPARPLTTRRGNTPRRETAQRVALFTGCLGKALDGDTLRAAIKLLQQSGYHVDIPTGQRCCGALDLHAGQQARAATLANDNLSSFDQSATVEAVITTASGCETTLREYGQRYGKDLPAIDICHFLQQRDQHNDRRRLNFRPLSQTVVVHSPCSQNIIPAAARATLAMLSRIPGIDLVTLSGHSCCGAAGRYLLDQPLIADRLRDAQLAELSSLPAAEILVSSNLGCALHLAAGLRRQGRRIEVIHPAVLLARQLVTAPSG